MANEARFLLKYNNLTWSFTPIKTESIESHRVLSLHRNMVYLSKNDIYIVRIYREIMGRVCETEVLSIFAEVTFGRAN